MTTKPILDGYDRRNAAVARRHAAVEISGNRELPKSVSNQEENDYGFVPVANFSKGLRHDDYGLATAADYKAFVEALNAVRIDPDTGRGIFDVPGNYDDDPEGIRQFESPLAGLYYSLEGPDPAAVVMAPAPRMGSSELCAEMAEVYAMALVRDTPFATLTSDDPTTAELVGSDGNPLVYPADYTDANKAGKNATVQDIVDELNKLSWFDMAKTPTSSSSSAGKMLTVQEKRRRAARLGFGSEDDQSKTKLTAETLFRGSAPGAEQGTYISQFMYLGTHTPDGKSSPVDGEVAFGAQTINQRVSINQYDFMTNWDDWLNVQQGAKIAGPNDYYTGRRRFIKTPRDLATYVHIDQLYQAYFNTGLIMLGNNVPFEPGFPNNNEGLKAGADKSSRGPFATFGGPHLLSLLTEVASRGLKAVRRQKFQIHRRARPEVIAARLAQVANEHVVGMPTRAINKLTSMLKELGHGDIKNASKPGVLLYWIAQMNERSNAAAGKSSKVLHDDKNYLLPMAFPEGSPMHPAYGAGHATVAGACVTVLKAFFETQQTPLGAALNVADFHQPDGVEGDTLVPAEPLGNATLLGELNKLAANISIGRNMAGVHYYSDYYDSLRLGERIAAGIIEEQMLNYNEAVTMSFISFDGEEIKISTDGKSTGASVKFEVNGQQTRDAWWNKHAVELETAFIG
ncbi:MAG: vanadium-dependent haloperoxidase [Pseudomonadota bacterium]